MSSRLTAWLVVGVLPLVASCASSRDSVVIGPVGPQPLVADASTPNGYLKVYTATKDHDDGHIHYYPHTGYTVYSEDGKTVVTKVRNAIGIHDEDPSLVQLPVGKYLVFGEAENADMVRVAVIVKPGRLTKVDLQHDWRQRPPYENTVD
jgi:hypothetical protein